MDSEAAEEMSVGNPQVNPAENVEPGNNVRSESSSSSHHTSLSHVEVSNCHGKYRHSPAGGGPESLLKDDHYWGRHNRLFFWHPWGQAGEEVQTMRRTDRAAAIR